MKRVQLAGLSLVLAAVMTWSCGGKRHGERHGADGTTPAGPPPTPDTTPIEALRTPAGLALKVETEATPAPSAPSRTPTPSGAKP